MHCDLAKGNHIFISESGTLKSSLSPRDWHLEIPACSMFPEIEGMEPQVTSQIKKKDTTGTHV